MSLTAEQIYWIVAVCQLILAAVIGAPTYWRFITLYPHLHPLIQSFAMLLVPDLFIVLNFVPLHLANLGLGETFDVGSFACHLSAFATLASILANNAGVIFIARATYLLVTRAGERLATPIVCGKTMGIWMAVGWLLGIIMAAAYAIDDNIGVHRNIYCCLKHLDKLSAILPTFTVFFTSGACMTYYYRKTFLFVRSVQEKTEKAARTGAYGPGTAQSIKPAEGRQELAEASTRDIERVATQSHASVGGAVVPVTSPVALQPVRENASTSVTAKVAPSRLSDRIMNRAIMLIGVYYVCWSWIAIQSLVTYIGVTTPLWSEIMAVVLIKCGPLLNVAIVRHMLQNSGKFLAKANQGSTVNVLTKKSEDDSRADSNGNRSSVDASRVSGFVQMTKAPAGQSPAKPGRRVSGSFAPMHRPSHSKVILDAGGQAQVVSESDAQTSGAMPVYASLPAVRHTRTASGANERPANSGIIRIEVPLQIQQLQTASRIQSAAETTNPSLLGSNVAPAEPSQPQEKEAVVLHLAPVVPPPVLVDSDVSTHEAESDKLFSPSAASRGGVLPGAATSSPLPMAVQIDGPQNELTPVGADGAFFPVATP